MNDIVNNRCDVMIAPMHGPADPPPIAITIKCGSSTLIRVEMTAEDFALAVTGRLVGAEITRGILTKGHQ